MRAAYTLLFLQTGLIFLFAFCTKYGENASGKSTSDGEATAKQYPFYQDVHVMVFVGFGFLVTFLKKYGYGSIAFNFLLAAFALQFSILSNGFFDQIDNGESWHRIPLDLVSLINADFAAAAVLITFGALFGKVGPQQLLLIAVLELCFYSLNAHLNLHRLEIVDIGGSMIIHSFGAYFGITVSAVLVGKDVRTRRESLGHRMTTHYHSDMFSMIGTLFLWIFWPSFNGALALPQTQERVIINTVLSLAASCVVTFMVSLLLRRKFNMTDVQNATLAGGVAIGATADLVVRPFGAVCIGSVGGLVSVLGYVFVQPMLEHYFHDTAGVHNLHGMPGVIGGLASVIAAAVADLSTYGPDNLIGIYPARVDRSAERQALYQLAALGVTLGVAVVGGAITGCVVRAFPLMNQTGGENMFADKHYWDMPDHGYDDTTHGGSSRGFPPQDQDPMAPTAGGKPLEVLTVPIIPSPAAADPQAVVSTAI